MPKTPDAIFVTMITPVPMRTPEGLGKLLHALESVEEFTPTHWGMDELARNPYDRDSMIATVSEKADDFHVPGLRRQRPPRYQAYFAAKNLGLKSVKLQFGSSLRVKDLPRVFLLGDALANQLEPEYGFVHLIWRLGEKSQEYSAAGVIKTEELQDFGPPSICTRTWLGPHLVQLFGRERLNSSSADTVDTTWGGVRVDLVAKPWLSDFETLSACQREIKAHLQPAGVFGDYSQPFDFSAGPNWVPFPESRGNC